MKCPDIGEAAGTTRRSDMQLYQEAMSCMELIASQLEKEVDYPMVDQLYRQCNDTIEQLRTSHSNPHISASLDNLLDTLNFQQSLLSSRRNGGASMTPERRRTLSEGYHKRRGRCKSESCQNRRASDRYDGRTLERCLEVEDMLLPPASDGDQTGRVTLDKMAGLDEVKQVLREAVVMPTQYPHLFQGGVKAWTRLLLYGPPGTGKTALACALATELQCPFYCVSPANLLSSWVGESEKLISELFKAAQNHNGRSVVFIDEIDSLCRIRSQTEDEHSRRVKTELLRHLEGMSVEGSGKVFVLASTNCPWDLDPAFLRRFQRRLYVPLPDRAARQTILQQQVSSSLGSSDMSWGPLLDATQGYSGADLTHLAMAATFAPIRELQAARFWMFTKDNKICPCSSDTLGAMQYTLSKLPADKVTTREVELKDFLTALKTTPRTVTPQAILRYEQFSQSHHTMVPSIAE